MNEFHVLSGMPSSPLRRPPSLRNLAAFEAAARLGSFAAAAEELNLTPSAVSHAIKSLELDVGTGLFARSGRGVALTAAGRTFATKVRIGLGYIAEAVGTPAASAPATLGVSTLHSIAGNVILPMLDRFQDNWPNVAIDLHLTETLDPMLGDRVDVGIRFGPGEWPGLSSRHLAEESLIAVCAPKLLDMHRAVDDLPLINHTTSSWQMWSSCADQDINFKNVRLNIDDAGAVLDAAVRGIGAALVRAKLAKNALRVGKLIALSEVQMPAEYAYYAVWRKGLQPTPVTSAFIDWLSLELSSNDEPTRRHVK